MGFPGDLTVMEAVLRIQELERLVDKLKAENAELRELREVALPEGLARDLWVSPALMRQWFFGGDHG